MNDLNIQLVTGQAGTGKTTWLMKKTVSQAEKKKLTEQQRVLLITRMHGSRRRIQAKVMDIAPSFPCHITTIDAFALSLLNRWRRSFGFSRPINGIPDESNFVVTPFGIDVDFDRAQSLAAELLRSPTIGKLIGNSFPLVSIDEFQDCHGSMLEFVQALSDHSSLILAADDFQQLKMDIDGCPAIDWGHRLAEEGKSVIFNLDTCYRTAEHPLLEAARRLREDDSESEATIPVICCPNNGPAAWHILKRLIMCEPDLRWTGTSAIITPSHDPFVTKVLSSCDNQLRKKSLNPIMWHVDCSIDDEQQQIRKNLQSLKRVLNSSFDLNAITESDSISRHVLQQALRFAKLRGIEEISNELLDRYIDKFVHDRRAYSSTSPKKLVTTVHGAKNREFDNVFVLWPFKLPPDVKQQRRMLYNAITRARKNCIVLVLGDINRANNDPVLSLLGPPQPAFFFRKKRAGRTGKNE